VTYDIPAHNVQLARLRKNAAGEMPDMPTRRDAADRDAASEHYLADRHAILRLRG
jgi:hypothetical protein